MSISPPFGQNSQNGRRTQPELDGMKALVHTFSMKIAFVNTTHKWGGVKTWCLDNARFLLKRGHSVLSYSRPGAFHQKMAGAGTSAMTFTPGPDCNPLAILYFYREFRRRKVDVCVCNVSKDMRTAGVAARLLGIPVVQHLGARADIRDTPKTRFFIRTLAPHFVTCSAFCRHELCRGVPLAATRPFAAIHPGVGCPDFHARLSHEPRVVIMTSQLLRPKGHELLFQALNALQDEGIEFLCRIVGTGPDEQHIKDCCRTMNLAGRTRFTGFSSDVPSQLAAADIFVMPSEEGLGIALEEAMAHGLACTALNAGGAPEIWPENRRDLLFDSVPRLTDVLRRLLTMPDDELLAIQRDFHDKALNSCNIDVQGEKFERWLADIVQCSLRG